MRHLLSMLFFLVSSVVLGQQTASVVGALSDKENNNEPLAFANILIQGTTIGTTSDFDGLYECQISVLETTPLYLAIWDMKQ